MMSATHAETFRVIYTELRSELGLAHCRAPRLFCLFILSLFLNPPSPSPVCCVSKPWHLYLVVLCYSVLLRLNLAFLVYLFYNLFYSSYLSYLIVIIVNSFMNQCRSLLFTTLVYLSEFFCYFILNCTFILIFIMCGILGLSGIDTI